MANERAISSNADAEAQAFITALDELEKTAPDSRECWLAGKALFRHLRKQNAARRARLDNWEPPWQGAEHDQRRVVAAYVRMQEARRVLASATTRHDVILAECEVEKCEGDYELICCNRLIRQDRWNKKKWRRSV